MEVNVFIIQILLFGFGVFLAQRDVKRHFLLIYVLVIYFLYIFLGPLNAYLSQDYKRFGNDFKPLFLEGIIIYSVALFCFIISYFINYNLITVNRSKYEYKLNKNYRLYLLGLFSIVLFVVFILPKNSGLMNYLLFLVDSLILALAIIFYEKERNIFFYVVLSGTILACLILGFRYRIILILVSFLYYLLLFNKFNLKSILKWMMFIYLVSAVLNVISINRRAFKESDFSNIKLTSNEERYESSYTLMLNQTNNFTTDFSVLEYMKENNVTSDYGNSMFLQTFIRLIPSSFFQYGKKPIIPQQDIIRKCFNSIEGYYAGAAVTNIFEYYIAFGFWGIIFFMSLLGRILAYYSKKVDLNNSRDQVVIVMIAMILFQEITRAYMPQVMTLLAYLYLSLKIFYKKNDRCFN